MKGLLSGLVLLMVLVTIPLQAQNQRGQRNTGTPEEMAAKQTERMKQNLGLSLEQTTKVEAINLKFVKKQREIRKAPGQDRTAMREAMAQVRKDRQLELKSVLSADQFKKMIDWEKEMIQRRGKGQRK
ncbi:hypothetical protein SAMN06265379_105157 [Saccharicrinis carchari]|uniref:LTXXQ motif family protein n=1 Tax=Saccharicrinis carchari TaxID=1168039 RepID=A0A521DFW5_SACCC|nr:hypothetical protein [Saccharicrinis carchari]SMO70472.1 hypothetical protein SAMN06265379_105157 [Saccharicrinis carchari]